MGIRPAGLGAVIGSPKPSRIGDLPVEILESKLFKPGIRPAWFPAAPCRTAARRPGRSDRRGGRPRPGTARPRSWARAGPRARPGASGRGSAPASTALPCAAVVRGRGPPRAGRGLDRPGGPRRCPAVHPGRRRRSRHTVRAQVWSVYRKLEVHTRDDAVPVRANWARRSRDLLREPTSAPDRNPAAPIGKRTGRIVPREPTRPQDRAVAGATSPLAGTRDDRRLGAFRRRPARTHSGLLGSYVSDDGHVTIRRSAVGPFEYSGNRFVGHYAVCAGALLIPA